MILKNHFVSCRPDKPAGPREYRSEGGRQIDLNKLFTSLWLFPYNYNI